MSQDEPSFDAQYDTLEDLSTEELGEVIEAAIEQSIQGMKHAPLGAAIPSIHGATFVPEDTEKSVPIEVQTNVTGPMLGVLLSLIIGEVSKNDPEAFQAFFHMMHSTVDDEVIRDSILHHLQQGGHSPMKP